MASLQAKSSGEPRELQSGNALARKHRTYTNSRMVLSTLHNFIYIRTKTTGSTTIETVLKENLGPDDIAMGRRLAALRPLLKPGAKIPGRGSHSPTHVAIHQIQPILREEFWQKAFKFTSERHPSENLSDLSFSIVAR